VTYGHGAGEEPEERGDSDRGWNPDGARCSGGAGQDIHQFLLIESLHDC
jgi:hypothetical protein